MGQAKCAKTGCTNDGTKSFDGLPDVFYCDGCFVYMEKKIARWNAELRATREERSREAAEDNRPARIQAEM